MKKTIAVGLLLGLSLPLSANELSTGMELEYNTVINNEITPLIINGVNASFDEHPYYAAITIIPDELVSGGSFSYIKNCGASILNNRFILTAAHCVEDDVFAEINEKYGLSSSWEDIHVIVGVSDTSNATMRNFYKIKTRNVHPNYLSIAGQVDQGRFLQGFEKYDIAILEIEKDIVHNVGSINHRGLNPSVYDQLDEWHGTGMGLTSYGGSPSNVLLTTPLSPGNDSSGLCSTRYSPETTICSIDQIENFGSTCQGDSGGPITYKDNGKHVQIGVVSYGTDPCGTGYSVFTEISAYESWIDSVVTHGEEIEYVPSNTEIPVDNDNDNENDNENDDNDNDNGEDSGGSSGGSTGLLSLLGLGLFYRRRNKE